MLEHFEGSGQRGEIRTWSKKNKESVNHDSESLVHTYTSRPFSARVEQGVLGGVNCG